MESRLQSMGYRHRRVHHAAQVYVQHHRGILEPGIEGVSGVNHAVSEKYLQS